MGDFLYQFIKNEDNRMNKRIDRSTKEQSKKTKKTINQEIKERDPNFNPAYHYLCNMFI